MLHIAGVLHLNLSFSSIPPSEYKTVIETCYWPLLEMASRHGNVFPVGIEMSGWTLERIRELDPKWVDCLKALVDDGWVDIISGGYNQIISPLVPYQINRANLIIGQQVFREILGITPKTLLVPEQCWSDALPRMAHGAGFYNIIMEYHNVATLHPDWSPEERFRPQLLSPVPDRHPLYFIWSDAIIWQHFQRTVQTTGEFPTMRPDTFLGNLRELSPPTAPGDNYCLMVYASDAEVFDYRPGKGKLDNTKNREWDNISKLWGRLGDWFRPHGLPSDLPQQVPCGIPPTLLGTASTPHPTKKQAKYNPLRWAVTGWAGHANQLSADITRRLYISPWGTGDATHLPGDGTKDLLRLWGSDYRTNVCPEKQREFMEILGRLNRVAEAFWITEING